MVNQMAEFSEFKIAQQGADKVREQSNKAAGRLFADSCPVNAQDENFKQHLSNLDKSEELYKDLADENYDAAKKLLQGAGQCGSLKILSPMGEPYQNPGTDGFALGHRIGSKEFVWNGTSPWQGKGFDLTFSEVQRSSGFTGFVKDLLAVGGLISPKPTMTEKLKVHIPARDAQSLQ
jgi:hypothetical protein